MVSIAPDVITRDDAGRATIRAIRLSEPLRIDGRLDDPISGFNARRVNRGKNDTSFLTRIPRSMGQTGLFRAS